MATVREDYVGCLDLKSTEVAVSALLAGNVRCSEGKLTLVEEVAEGNRSTSHGMNFVGGLEPSEVGADLILPLSPVGCFAVLRVL